MAPRFAFVPARWLAPDSGLTPPDRLTLCILCIWVNRESGECFPSVSTIAEHAALSESTVRVAIKRLRAFGALEVERRTDAEGNNQSNMYTILGYDPAPRVGGTSTTGGGVPQPPEYPTSTDGVEVPQPPDPNVLKLNNEVNTARADDSAKASSACTVYTGPTDLIGRKIVEYLDSTPPTQADRENWRAELRGIGARPPEEPQHKRA